MRSIRGKDAGIKTRYRKETVLHYASNQERRIKERKSGKEQGLFSEKE